MSVATAVKERPILFSGEMVRAILEGRKTQTRRVKGLKQINSDASRWQQLKDFVFQYRPSADRVAVKCPYGQPGDRLWVRETFVLESTYEYHEEELRPTDRPYQECGDEHQGHYFLIPHYRATEPEPHIVPYDRVDGYDDTTSWRPSIFMPRYASRITLEITEIQVERVQKISEVDAQSEGVAPIYTEPEEILWHRPAFQRLWDSINGEKYPWASDPWVWVVGFKRLEATG